jgi:membrane protein DedA with SNARE-associated domain
MTADPTTGPEETQDQQFGLKHLASILFAVGITVLIFVFRDQVRELDELAYLGGFLAMLIGNATILLPVPGLIFVFALGGTLNPLLVALTAAPGAALGEFTGYAAGYGGSAIVDNWKRYYLLERWMKRYGLLVIIVLAAIPNPIFDLAGIVAGTLRMKWWHFLLSALVGKLIQALMIAYAGALSLDWVSRLLA